MTKPVPGTFNDYPSLASLPPLVRRQRRLEQTIAAIGDAIADEKAVRGEIDVLLLAAGLGKGELVTCAGYDVIHLERDGQTSIDGEVLAALLLDAGVDGELVTDVLLKSTKTGKPAKYAAVRPSKGAKVRRS